MTLKGLDCSNEHRGIAISAPIGFSTKQVNDVSYEFPFLALFRAKEDVPIKRAQERQRRDESTEEGPPRKMVFSKDAYSSGRCETASKEKQGDTTPIFTHFLSGVSQRERRLSRR